MSIVERIIADVGESDEERLQSLDIAGIVTSALGAIGLFLFPLASAPFAAMFKDLGGAELPVLTRVALTAWFPLLLGGIASTCAFLGARLRGSISRRRALIVVAVLVAGAGVIACVIGMYLPIFTLAGSIKAD
jgi:hypothetical protein